MMVNMFSVVGHFYCYQPFFYGQAIKQKTHFYAHSENFSQYFL